MNLNFIKMKNICSVKDTIKRIKRQATYWEKIFANHISSKDLYPDSTKNTSKINSKKINNPIKNQAKNLNRHLYHQRT